MKHLVLLSPILLVACVQHQDPCVVQRPCNPTVKECVCVQKQGGKDPVRVVGDPSPDAPVGDNGGSSDENGVVSDDTNGSVSSDNSSDKNKDRPRESHSRDSDDSNGGNSDD